jgi:hypothetical protein
MLLSSLWMLAFLLLTVALLSGIVIIWYRLGSDG